jgi:hypothetical protein
VKVEETLKVAERAGQSDKLAGIEDLILARLREIKTIKDFTNSWQAANSLYSELNPEGKFYHFNLEDPRKSYAYTVKKQGERAPKFFWAIAVGLKEIKEKFGSAPIGKNCFVIEGIKEDGEISVIEGEIMNISQDSHLKIKGIKGSWRARSAYPDRVLLDEYLNLLSKQKGKEYKVKIRQDKKE